MGCLLWIQLGIYVLPQLWESCMRYLVVLDCVITALNCSSYLLHRHSLADALKQKCCHDVDKISVPGYTRNCQNDNLQYSHWKQFFNMTILLMQCSFLTPATKYIEWELTHWGRDKMDAISQTTLSNAFSWIKMCEFRFRFHWSLFLGFELTIFQHWFR